MTSDESTGIGARGGGPHIDLVLGDIADERVDVIVNAASPTLAPTDTGVDRALRRRAGASVERQLAETAGRASPLPLTMCTVTTAGLLSARWILHAIVPGARAHDAEDLLAATYANALRTARALEATTVAFPALGAGMAGFAPAAVARVALRVVRAPVGCVQSVRFVFFRKETYTEFVQTFIALAT